MKFLLAFLVVCGISSVYSDVPALSPESPQVKQCMTEHGITKDMLIDLDKTPNFVADHKMECFAACVMKAKNLMDANGKYTDEYMKSELKDMCKTDYGKDQCETAGKVLGCLVRILQEDRKDKLKAAAAKSS